MRHSPKPLAVVKWYRIYADWYKTDTPLPGGVVNKTQPKAPLPREGFGMNIDPNNDKGSYKRLETLVRQLCGFDTASFRHKVRALGVFPVPF